MKTINPEKEKKIIQKCIVIASLNHIRGEFYVKNRKDDGDRVTPRIHKAIFELRDLFFNERNMWWE